MLNVAQQGHHWKPVDVFHRCCEAAMLQQVLSVLLLPNSFGYAHQNPLNPCTCISLEPGPIRWVVTNHHACLTCHQKPAQCKYSPVLPGRIPKCSRTLDARAEFCARGILPGRNGCLWSVHLQQMPFCELPCDPFSPSFLTTYLQERGPKNAIALRTSQIPLTHLFSCAGDRSTSSV